MRIAIYHSNFASDAGGAEVFALRAAKALKELGHEVDLYTSLASESALRAACDSAGTACQPPKLLDAGLNDVYVRVARLLAERRVLISLFLNSVFRHMAGKAFSSVSELSSRYDLVITMQAPIPLINNINYLGNVPGDLTYFHYPSTHLVLLGKYIPDSLNPLVRLYKRLIMKLEYVTLKEVGSYFARTYKVATNSSWTKRGLIDLFSKVSEALPAAHIWRLVTTIKSASVIYPPIDYDLLSAAYDPNSKKDLVLTVSRYYYGKNLWSVIYTASKVTDAHFIIAGTTMTPDSNKVIAELEVLADRLRVKNVTLEKDVPRRRLTELYEEAKVYLHPLYAEHFGIAIAEGAAAGAVPVVYKDGGGWTDIASRIDPTLGYINVNEAASIVKSLLGGRDLWLRLSRRSVKVAEDFSWGNFKRRLNVVVRETYEMKRRSHHKLT